MQRGPELTSVQLTFPRLSHPIFVLKEEDPINQGLNPDVLGSASKLMCHFPLSQPKWTVGC